MNRSDELERRLVAWGKEYGGGRWEDIGWKTASPIAQLMKYHGRAPQGVYSNLVQTDGPADQVEFSVRALELQPKGYTPACVLRCEYFATTYSREEKLLRLKRAGNRMDTSRYSHHLRMAKVHVAAWLHVPFDEPVDDDQRISLLEYLVS